MTTWLFIFFMNYARQVVDLDQVPVPSEREQAEEQEPALLGLGRHPIVLLLPIRLSNAANEDGNSRVINQKE